MLTASTEDMEEMDSIKPSFTRGKTPKPHNWLGVKAGLDEAKQAIEQKDLDTAEQLLREIIEFAPAEHEAWHILAAILNRKGQTEAARECLKRVIKLNGTNISLQETIPSSKRMAKLLWAKQEHIAALDMLAELLLKSPDDTELQTLQQTWTASA